MKERAAEKRSIVQDPVELFDLAPVPYAVLNSFGTIIQANQAFLKLIEPRELPLDFPTLLDEGSRDNLVYLLERVKKSPLVHSEELKVLWTGSPQWTLADMRKSQSDESLFFLVLTDIAQKKAVERHLKDAVQSKDLLLRELNHRVKNNLQMISSMISLQISQTGNEETSLELSRIQDRLVSLSFLFDLLYGSGQSSRVDLTALLRELVGYLAASSLPDHWQNTWSLEGKVIMVDASRALTCGQIFHELMTNVFKHSFPQLTDGFLKIRTELTETQWIVTMEELGKWDKTLIHSNSGFGHLLVNILTDQLGAELTLVESPGTVWTLKAPL